MKRRSEETPKHIELPVPPEHRFLTITDEQAVALVAAQTRLNETIAAAQEAIRQVEGLRDALLLGITAGANLSSCRAIRVTDEKPARLEVELSSNGNGAGK